MESWPWPVSQGTRPVHFLLHHGRCMHIPTLTLNHSLIYGTNFISQRWNTHFTLHPVVMVRRLDLATGCKGYDEPLAETDGCDGKRKLNMQPAPRVTRLVRLGWFQWSPGCISLSPTPHQLFLSLSPSTALAAGCSIQPTATSAFSLSVSTIIPDLPFQNLFHE
jgi:hypothetical protein